MPKNSALAASSPQEGPGGAGHRQRPSGIDAKVKRNRLSQKKSSATTGLRRPLERPRGHSIRSLLYHGSCIDPTHQFHTLDPTTQVPFSIPQVPIKLLIKDFHYIGINRTRNMANLLKKGIFKNAWFSHNQIYGMQIDLSIE